MQCRWFSLQGHSVFVSSSFLASYLIQSLLGCPGSRNGKLVDTVSMNASIKTALANAGNEKGKGYMACNIYNIYMLYDIYLFFLEIASKRGFFIGTNE